MEEVISRFPHIAEQIFEELDHYHFIQCKGIGQSWKNFMEGSKFSYIRLIKTSTDCYTKQMKKVIKETNLEDTILLASDVSKLYNELQKDKVGFQRLIRRKGRLVTKPSLTLFHMAAKRGSLSVCKLIIDSIKNKHPKCGTIGLLHGQTPLHFAAEKGHLSICQLILEKDDDKSQPQVDYIRNSPLHLAAKFGHLSVCELLIGSYENAYPNAANTFGCTPLHLAAGNGHLSVCRLLLGKVTNRNMEEELGLTPLGCAARTGHSAICHLLLESGVDVNVRDMYGQTALHFAAENNLLSVCQKILETCIDHNPEDDNGKTPFHLALMKGHQEVCDLLSDSALSSTRSPNATFLDLLQTCLSKRRKLS